MKALIVDDEPKARNLLRVILEERCKQIDHILEAPDLAAGVRCIRNEQPDIVFLDIEMPGYLGTQIMELMEPEEITFGLVFTTAYSEYAIKAFQMNAVNYLLKPIRPQQVEEAVQTVHERHYQDQLAARLSELKQALSQHSFQKIGLPVSDGVLFVPFEELIHLQADGMYTRVNTKTHSAKIVSKPLRFFCDLLQHHDQFYKPHRSHLINLNYIQQFVRKDGNYIVLENGQTVPLSKEKKEEFLGLVNLL